MRVLICCLTLALGSGFAAERIEHANFHVYSIPYDVPNGVPGVVQGIGGVGHYVPGAPCIVCFGVPNRTEVFAMPMQMYSPGQMVSYYYSVQTTGVTGNATFTVTLTQGNTTIQTLTGSGGLAANSVNVIVDQPVQIPSVTGLVTITFTTTINNATVQGTTHMEVR